MTAYAASFSFTSAGSGPTQNVAVKAGTYPCRIQRVEAIAGGATYVGLYNFSGSTTLSGGTALTPVALRGGAPATTATCKIGVTGISGTQSYITSINIGSTFYDPSAMPLPGSGSYDFPFDYIVPSGGAVLWSSTLFPFGSASSLYYGLTIYYEELRLSWSF